MKTQDNGHRWSEEEMRKLIALFMAGDSYVDIATALNVTAKAVSKMIMRLRKEGVPIPRRKAGHVAGRSNTPWTQEEVEFVVRRRTEKATAEQIANELNRSFYAVSGMISKLRQEGVSVPMLGQGVRKLWSAEKIKAAIAGRELTDKMPSLRLVS